MLRGFLIAFLFTISGVSVSQTAIGTSFRSGINRVGVYFDQSLNFNLSGHQFDAGLRYYGPDYVFESNLVGMTWGYNYNFTADRFYFAPGIIGTFFHENKSTVELYVSEVLLAHKIGVSLGRRWSVFSHLGIGVVFNKHTNFNLGTETTTSYIHYEIALGIKYYWRIPAD